MATSEIIEEMVTFVTGEQTTANTNVTSRSIIDGFRPDDFSRTIVARFLKKDDNWMPNKTRLTWTEIELVYNTMSDDEKCDMAESWEKLSRLRITRFGRYDRLNELLTRHGLKIRGDSELCKRFVFFAQGDIRDIVFTMHKINVCFKNGADEEFKEVTKIRKDLMPEEYMSVRDRFFDAFYTKKIIEQPALDFRWVQHPLAEKHRQQRASNTHNNGGGFYRGGR